MYTILGSELSESIFLMRSDQFNPVESGTVHISKVRLAEIYPESDQKCKNL